MVGYNAELLEMTVHGFRLFALCYLFCGINIYASSFFTALCNGALSALISFLRSLLLRGGMVLLMPILFDLDGIWTAVIAAEGLGAVVSFGLLYAKRRQRPVPGKQKRGSGCCLFCYAFVVSAAASEMLREI